MHVTLILSGPQGSGKSILAEAIQDWLLAIGVPVEADPDHGPVTPPRQRQLPPQGVTVSIVEVQSQDTI